MPLAEAAAQTRITERYLAAIEAGDLDRLPGAFFAKSFIRQYAKFLEIASVEIEPELERLLTQVAPPLIPGQEPRKEGSDLPPIVTYAAPSGDRRLLRAIGGLVAVVVVCAAVYGLWLRQRDTGVLETVAQADRPAPTPAVTEQEPASAGEEPQAATPAPAAEARGPLWFQIVAQEETWVDITSDGRRLYQGVLEANQTKTLSGLERARLVVGNAGGLRIVSNGRPIGPIGERGQVRVVMLSPDGAEVFTPRRRAPEEGESEPHSGSLRG